MATPEEIDSIIGGVDVAICTLASTLDPDTAFSLGCEWRAVLSFRALSQPEVHASLREVQEILRSIGKRRLSQSLEPLVDHFSRS